MNTTAGIKDQMIYPIYNTLTQIIQRQHDC